MRLFPLGLAAVARRHRRHGFGGDDADELQLLLVGNLNAVERIVRPMALRQASAEWGGSRGATAGAGRAGCGPIVKVQRSFLSTLKAGFFSLAQTGLEAVARPDGPHAGRFGKRAEPGPKESGARRYFPDGNTPAAGAHGKASVPARRQAERRESAWWSWEGDLLGRGCWRPLEEGSGQRSDRQQGTADGTSA